jgi:hypothetical protein
MSGADVSAYSRVAVKVSAFSIFPTVVDVLCASGISDVSVVPAVVVVTSVAGLYTVVWLTSLNYVCCFPLVTASKLLTSHDVLVVSCLCRIFC